MSSLIEMGQKAKDAAVVLATLSTPAKNKALLASADALLAAKAEILAKNKADVDAAVEAGIKGAFIDRLTLTEARLADMAEGLRQVAKLDDHENTGQWTRDWTEACPHGCHRDYF